jgi:hypothetical protein
VIESQWSVGCCVLESFSSLRSPTDSTLADEHRLNWREGMKISAVAALLPLVATTVLTLPSVANELEVSNLLQREDIKSLALSS